MVLGSYYLTYVNDKEDGAGKVFVNEDEVMLAYNDRIIGIHAPIKVRREFTYQGNTYQKLVEITAGRIIFNQNIPQDLGFVDRSDNDHVCDYEINMTCGKKELGKIVDRTIREHGFTVASEVLDNIKSTGYKYSTRGAITISIYDMSVPAKKYELIKETEHRIVDIENEYKMGFMTNDERYRAVVREWEKTTEDVTNALQDNLEELNPIYMMATSGARGSMKQIRQLAGMRGLMANTAGRTIEIPIKSNFREGLSVLEYFISSRGARKGHGGYRSAYRRLRLPDPPSGGCLPGCDHPGGRLRRGPWYLGGGDQRERPGHREVLRSYPRPVPCQRYR